MQYISIAIMINLTFIVDGFKDNEDVQKTHTFASAGQLCQKPVGQVMLTLCQQPGLQCKETESGNNATSNLCKPAGFLMGEDLRPMISYQRSC